MNKTQFNIYLDESCHLESDGLPVMCIGNIKVNTTHYESIITDLKLLKLKYHAPTELKWNKLSASRLSFYKELIDYFFNQEYLFFKAILVKSKDDLKHNDFNQGSHDNFYFKLIYHLLYPSQSDFVYRVFLDIKDTRGRERLKKIKDVFNHHYKEESPFLSFQYLHSHDNILIELADFFIGAITYKARNLKTSKIKQEVIAYIEKKSGYHIDEGTEPWEVKFNIFEHHPKKRLEE
jgi:Protein of unknown function (DUF3800)